MKYQFLFLLMLIIPCSKAQDKHQNVDHKMAIKSYDPVAYFVSGPAEGNKDISTEYNGAVYYFLSEKNKTLYLKNLQNTPLNTVAIVLMPLVKTPKSQYKNPKTFNIIEGKRYLFYNAILKTP